MTCPTPYLAGLFDFGGTEILVIMVVVLIFFGGEKLPGLARGLGKAIREFKKATSGIEEEFKRAMEEPPKRPTPRRPEIVVAKTEAPDPAAPLDHLETPPADPSAFEHGEH
ncbi:MAG TPA: twin-arginine translocase TatA/TatE family subunit [Opitutaceae bacterium]|jgi:TatA/E family protein of Tat protein translocase|nr:twin-arginine translocase TatA/TatE family subunit [Opitutaceae bacterium]